jgi:hypothetical protein
MTLTNHYKLAEYLSSKIEPGQSYQLYFGSYKETRGLFLDSACFGERVLENIVGSSFEWFYLEKESGYIFARLPKPYPAESGLRSFISEKDLELDTHKGFPGRYVSLKHGYSTYYNQSDVPILERVYYDLKDVRRDFPCVDNPFDIVTIPVFKPTPYLVASVSAKPRNDFIETERYILKERYFFDLRWYVFERY